MKYLARARIDSPLVIHNHRQISWKFWNNYVYYFSKIIPIIIPTKPLLSMQFFFLYTFQLLKTIDRCAHLWGCKGIGGGVDEVWALGTRKWGGICFKGGHLPCLPISNCQGDGEGGRSDLFTASASQIALELPIPANFFKIYVLQLITFELSSFFDHNFIFTYTKHKAIWNHE